MPDPLPHLTDRDQQLLRAFFAARCDLGALAASESLSVPDILAWSRSSAVRAHLADLTRPQKPPVHRHHGNLRPSRRADAARLALAGRPSPARCRS